jgi:hypothetical protein
LRGFAWPSCSLSKEQTTFVDYQSKESLDLGEYVRESLRRILLTVPGERLLRPGFGCLSVWLTASPEAWYAPGLWKTALEIGRSEICAAEA